MSVQLTIRMLDGGAITLSAETNDTVQSIKIKIQNKHGILQDSQRLIYCETELNNDNILSDFIINKHCTLYLAIKLGWRTRTTVKYIKFIYIKTLSGSNMSFPFYEHATILSIKKQISERDCIPISCQLLIFLGKHLNNNSTLSTYNIKAESTLHLVVKPINIFIKSENNEIFPIRMHNTATILNLKEYMMVTENITTEQQKMSLYGKVLHNNYTIKQCKFKHFDVIELNVNFEQLYKQKQRNIIQNMSTKIREKLKHDIKHLDDILSDSERKINELISLCNMSKTSHTLLANMDQYIINSEKEVVNMQSFYKHSYIAKKTMNINHGKKMVSVRTLKNQYRDYLCLDEVVLEMYDKLYVEKIKTIIGYIKDCRFKSNCYENILQNCLKNVDDEIVNIESLHQKKMEYVERLQEIIDKKIIYFEKKYDEWNTKELIAWIQIIENKYFDKKKFKIFLDILNDMGIKGGGLNEMNSTLFLNVIGLKDKNTEYILRKHINRIIQYKSDREYHNICGLCTENIINTVMIPCGHCYSCYECSLKLPIGNLRCPICRKYVIQIVQTYMSGFTRLNK
eukprot:206597_1